MVSGELRTPEDRGVAEALRLAEEMWAVTRQDEQCARVVTDDATAAAIRAQLRRLAAHDGVAIRTARLDDTVVAVRLDATVWTEDAATMRRKLTPAARRS